MVYSSVHLMVAPGIICQAVHSLEQPSVPPRHETKTRPSDHTFLMPPWYGLHMPRTLSLSERTFFPLIFLFFSPLACINSSAFWRTCSLARFRTQIAFSRPLM